MKLIVVAVGHRLPAWAQAACDEYLHRFSDWKVELRPVRPQEREGKDVAGVMQIEARRIEAVLEPGCRRVVLDEHGTHHTSQAFAHRVQSWREAGQDVALIIGGADGLDPALKAGAHETLRLADMTLPHALARVLLLEQLYRAWSLVNQHPYHRA